MIEKRIKLKYKARTEIIKSTHHLHTNHTNTYTFINNKKVICNFDQKKENNKKTRFL